LFKKSNNLKSVASSSDGRINYQLIKIRESFIPTTGS